MLVWAKGAGASGFDSGYGVATDSQGNVYVTGYYRLAATFGRGGATETELRIFGDVDIFVAKLNTNGDLQWATGAGSGGDDRGFRIAADASGSVLVTGRFVATATFGFGSAGQTNLVSALGSDVFIAKYRDAAPILAVPAGGTATFVTTGVSPSVRAGYAKTTVLNGATPFGVAVFSLTQNGFVVSEAGVPASPPTQSARIFIDFRSAVPSGSGVLDIDTGFAISNGRHRLCFLKSPMAEAMRPNSSSSAPRARARSRSICCLINGMRFAD